jgi:hypothetical protein
VSDLVERYHVLWKRWSAIVWHREELRRIIEMVRDDPRLLHSQSTYVRDAREWFVDHACAALFGEIEGTKPSAARTMVEEATADFPAFLGACKDPGAIDSDEVQRLWQAVLADSRMPLDWFRSERLLLLNDAPQTTHDDLDRAIAAVEGLILRLGRAIEGAAPSGLLATEQFDWYDVFALPWRPRDEAEMPDFESHIPPSTSTREVAIFPWLDLRKPISALGITILPRAQALLAVGDDEDALRARTNYFYDEHRMRLTPSVALFPDGDVDVSRARIARAAHAVLFSSSARNAPGNPNYANATLLEYFFQRLGGESEFVARRVRRRYGSRLGGSHTALIRAQRPDWSGGGLDADSELLGALQRIADDVESDNLFDALRWYYVGSTDADPIPPDIDRIHIRTAIERLLQAPDDERSPSTGEQLKRVARLTEKFTTWLCDTHKGERRNFHQQALWVLVHDRNVSVHGRPDPRTPHHFERMGVPLDWIFDRLFISLTVATLISKGALQDAARWRAFIESFELWLAGAQGSLSEIWSGRTIALATRTWDAEPRPPLDIDTALLDPAFVYVRPRE